MPKTARTASQDAFEHWCRQRDRWFADLARTSDACLRSGPFLSWMSLCLKLSLSAQSLFFGQVARSRSMRPATPPSGSHRTSSAVARNQRSSPLGDRHTRL